MAIILGSCFFGLSVLAPTSSRSPRRRRDGAVAHGQAPSSAAAAFLYYVLQFSTFAILILAANTAYADFPRLARSSPRDGFLPRQLANRGDRLVFSNGVIVLAALAGLLIVVFGGDTTALIPLYAVGVFTGLHALPDAAWSCTTGGSGSPAGRSGMAINVVGAIASGIVLLVVVVSKFTIGAWIPVVVIPLFVLSSARSAGTTTRCATPSRPPRRLASRGATSTPSCVLVGNVNKGVLEAVNYARSLAPDRLVAVSVVGDADEQEALARRRGTSSRHPGRAAHHLLALPGADRAGAASTSTSSTPSRPTT